MSVVTLPTEMTRLLLSRGVWRFAWLFVSSVSLLYEEPRLQSFSSNKLLKEVFGN